MEAAIRGFDPAALRDWAAGLGEATFVGTSGRVFPQAMRATPLLRAWLRRLDGLGVRVRTRMRWCGWAPDGALLFRGPGDVEEVVRADATVFALGGASWPRVGSDGGWVSLFRDAGVVVHELGAANCGVLVPWSARFVEQFAGQPLKNVGLRVGEESARGGVMITDDGLEGGPVYTLTAALRAALGGGDGLVGGGAGDGGPGAGGAVDRLDDGGAVLWVDLHPDLDVEAVTARLEKRRQKDSVANTLRRTLGFTPAMVAFLREMAGGVAVPSSPADLAALVKAVPVRVTRLAPLARAISSAGGVALDEVDDAFMLHRRPGTYVVGEMLDWEAPTGGYLLQATFSTAVAAARHLRDAFEP